MGFAGLGKYAEENLFWVIVIFFWTFQALNFFWGGFSALEFFFWEFSALKFFLGIFGSRFYLKIRL